MAPPVHFAKATGTQNQSSMQMRYSGVLAKLVAFFMTKTLRFRYPSKRRKPQMASKICQHMIPEDQCITCLHERIARQKEMIIWLLEEYAVTDAKKELCNALIASPNP
jgi:hypothetical protein